MKRKTYPTVYMGTGSQQFFEPLPLDKQPKVRKKYIWNIPPAEWPAGITAEQVAEMKRRHNKKLRAQRAERKKAAGVSGREE